MTLRTFLTALMLVATSAPAFSNGVVMRCTMGNSGSNFPVEPIYNKEGDTVVVDLGINVASNCEPVGPRRKRKRLEDGEGVWFCSNYTQSSGDLRRSTVSTMVIDFDAKVVTSVKPSTFPMDDLEFISDVEGNTDIAHFRNLDGSQ